MNKNPAFLFYAKDWLADLQEHPLEIEGAWIRFCAKAWTSDSLGSVEFNLDQWARLFGVDRPNALRILTYIFSEKIGDFSEDLTKFSVDSPEKIKLICRRMNREEKIKKGDRLRKKESYQKKRQTGSTNGFSGDSPENLTPPLPVPVPVPVPEVNISYLTHPSFLPPGAAEEGVCQEKNFQAKKIERPAHPIQCAEDFPLELQQIFDAYPEPRQDRTAAMQAHRKSIADREWPGLATVLDDLLVRTQLPDWTRENYRFTPKLSKCIRSRMWLDPMPSARASPDDPISDIAARIRKETQEAATP
ncbi:MAG: hypothetical protein HQK81_10965 [Desulfovibrionaceae bacterium]|nr:hypothetical protein [Desulfovibrionaceae bacterium]MBF0514562.1 hypothetical protein [Desulfovibrionaceae bacterium]